MYEAASRQKAFVCDSVVSCIRMQMQETPTRINSLLSAESRIPIALEATIARCLEKNPNKRFQSMDEVSQSLQTCDKAPSWWQGLVFSISLLPTAGRANIVVSFFALVILLSAVVSFSSYRKS